ncbi:MAG TPA: transcriptional repressor [Polyangia bacterium]|nr:transcriptional repressor [Polyangia bacterium]
MTVLQEHGIQPSAQRVAVAEYVLHTDEHPSADTVWKEVQRRLPQISRATVYNTLNLFVEKGLLRELEFAAGIAVFDSNLERHHHFIDEDSGRIYDLPWSALTVSHVEKLEGYEVHDYQVVVRGRRAPRRKR